MTHDQTTGYPVQDAMRAAIGDLDAGMQSLVSERIKIFLRALSSDGQPVAVTGARYSGGTPLAPTTTTYHAPTLASYIGDWPR